VFVLNKIDPRALLSIPPPFPIDGRIDLVLARRGRSTSSTRPRVPDAAIPLCRLAPAHEPSAAQSMTIGVVGFPNVGKSSLINTLKRAPPRCPSPAY
jgi:50S ribosome-binding GTPase